MFFIKVNNFNEIVELCSQLSNDIMHDVMLNLDSSGFFFRSSK